MKTRVYYNRSDVPVVIDEEGHIVAGHGWRASERNDQIRNALDIGTLLQFEPDAKIAKEDSEAGKAHKEAIEANAEEDAQKQDTGEKKDKQATEEVTSDSEPTETQSVESGK